MELDGSKLSTLALSHALQGVLWGVWHQALGTVGFGKEGSGSHSAGAAGRLGAVTPFLLDASGEGQARRSGGGRGELSAAPFAISSKRQRNHHVLLDAA